MGSMHSSWKYCVKRKVRFMSASSRSPAGPERRSWRRNGRALWSPCRRQWSREDFQFQCLGISLSSFHVDIKSRSVVRSVIPAVLLSLALLLPCLAQGTDRFERISPEQAGYSSEKLEKLREALHSSGSQSMVLLHDGKVFFEWGDIRKKILVHSIRKALLSSLYGIYVERGAIDLQQTLAQLDIDDAPQALNAQERSALLLDLLKSRSGVYHAAAAEAESMIGAMPKRGQFAAGAHYYYNNWDFNVAGHVFERASGMRIYDAFDKHIAQPFGFCR
ncbi:serine hydrolase [Massilia glaciei]|nr:serine hydrolase [Massilia glaciei]